jgi:hypothetical protein
MDNLTRHVPQRSSLWDALAGAVGGVLGTLLLNTAIPETGFPYVLYVFVLPGLTIGTVVGYLLGSLIGRRWAALVSSVVAFLVVLLGVILLVTAGG